MSLALLFHYLRLDMFRMLVHPSSGACDLLWIYFMCCVALVRCVLVLRCGSAEVVWYPYAGWSRATISRKLLKVDVLTFETCWAVNSEIIKQVTSSWSIFIQQICMFITSTLDVRVFSAPRSDPFTWWWVLTNHWIGCWFDVRYVLGVLEKRIVYPLAWFEHRLSALLPSPNPVQKL